MQLYSGQLQFLIDSLKVWELQQIAVVQVF